MALVVLEWTRQSTPPLGRSASLFQCSTLFRQQSKVWALLRSNSVFLFAFRFFVTTDTSGENSSFPVNRRLCRSTWKSQPKVETSNSPSCPEDLEFFLGRVLPTAFFPRLLFVRFRAGLAWSDFPARRLVLPPTGVCHHAGCMDAHTYSRSTLSTRIPRALPATPQPSRIPKRASWLSCPTFFFQAFWLGGFESSSGGGGGGGLN